MDKQKLKRVNRIYREPILIERLNESRQDTSGVWHKSAWQPWREVHANLKNLYGQEYFAAGQTNQQNTVKFTIRFIPGLDNEVKSSYRIRYRGKIYNISFVDNIGYADEELELKAIERSMTDGAI